VVEKQLVFTEKEINRRICELGREITSDYAGCDLTVIGILNGAFIFTADLVRRIDLPVEVDFIRVASYGSATYSSGTVHCSKDVELAIEDRHIILVEDIVDTGLTLAAVKEMLVLRNPRSIRVCALIDKRERREEPVSIDYSGFSVEKGFLVGYGLDYAEKYRNLPAVYHLVGK